jgi:radical SAM superfamily enzyme YgiQ (UPF0313 family)
LQHHVSGQLKIAPEHIQEEVLRLMGKPGQASLEKFLKLFQEANQGLAQKAYLTYYLLAAHPGCTQAHMHHLRTFALNTLHLLPEQVQIFTPTPSTFATLMYHTEKDPFTRSAIYVEKAVGKKQQQKETVCKPTKAHRKRTRKQFGRGPKR